MTCPVLLLRGRLSRRRAVARAVDQVHPDAHSRGPGGGGALVVGVRGGFGTRPRYLIVCLWPLPLVPGGGGYPPPRMVYGHSQSSVGEGVATKAAPTATAENISL